MKQRKSKRSKIALINQDTGEILDGLLAYYGVKYNPYKKGWIMNSQEGLELLASDSGLSKESYRILIFLMSKLEFENWINIFQKEIADKLGIKKQNVSRAISLLESKEIILRGPKVGKSYSFRFNPDFGWKGDPENLKKYRRGEEEERIKDLKNKTNKRKEKKLRELSEKYKMPPEELQVIQKELNLLN